MYDSKAGWGARPGSKYDVVISSQHDPSCAFICKNERKGYNWQKLFVPKANIPTSQTNAAIFPVILFLNRETQSILQ